MKLLATKLVQRGHEVILEPHIPEGLTFRNPDIVVSSENDLTVVEIAVAGEELLESVYAGKFRIYSIAEVQ
ncbi:unnamed protein product [Schistocephalus solidus]|uniref:UDP-N-acetylglucosamine 2-epimerase n=1 Tax=Schistocephalus solidus TaxID=70667 RepID=A0A183TUN7_SCHSO|nr:unnamed protein product [Schistocephalus solidus]